MARQETYSYGQGKVYLARRGADGSVQNQRWVGMCRIYPSPLP